MRPSPTGLLILVAALAACQDTSRSPEPRAGSGRAETPAAGPDRGSPPASPAAHGPGSASFVAHGTNELPDVGVPPYPGAHALAGGTWQLSDGLDEGTGALTTFTLFTPHALATVVEFYRGQLELDPAAIFTLEDQGRRTVSMTVETRTHTVNLLLRESANPQGTRIEFSAMAATAQTPPT